MRDECNCARRAAAVTWWIAERSGFTSFSPLRRARGYGIITKFHGGMASAGWSAWNSRNAGAVRASA